MPQSDEHRGLSKSVGPRTSQQLEPRRRHLAGLHSSDMRNAMRSAKKPKIQWPPTTTDYQPDELETMRQAFIRACSENPELAATHDQRYDLAEALVSVYQKGLTQSELVVGAIRKVKKSKS